MTIRYYNTAPELNGTDINARKAGRFELIMATRKSLLAKPSFYKVEFTVTGTTQDALDTAAIAICEEIGALSGAKMMKFAKVLGHYRQDEIIPVVAVNRRQMGMVGYSPDPEDGLEALNLVLKIPYFIGSLADAEALVGTRSAAGGTAALGNVRWTDQAETALEACYGEYYRGTNIVDMEKLYNEPLTSTNTENGLGDSVIGPKL